MRVPALSFAATISQIAPKSEWLSTTGIFFFLLPGLHIGCGLSRLWPEALRAFHFRIQAAEATLGECSSYPGEQHLKRGEQQLKKDEQKHTEPLTASV